MGFLQGVGVGLVELAQAGEVDAGRLLSLVGAQGEDLRGGAEHAGDGGGHFDVDRADLVGVHGLDFGKHAIAGGMLVSGALGSSPEPPLRRFRLPSMGWGVKTQSTIDHEILAPDGPWFMSR